MAFLGFVVGSFASQAAGAWAYWRVRKRFSGSRGDWQPRLVGAVVAALVATALYTPFGVHTWLTGQGTHWGASAFLGFSMALCQAVLFPGRPRYQRHAGTGRDRPGNDSTGKLRHQVPPEQ